MDRGCAAAGKSFPLQGGPVTRATIVIPSLSRFRTTKQPGIRAGLPLKEHFANVRNWPVSPRAARICAALGLALFLSLPSSYTAAAGTARATRPVLTIAGPELLLDGEAIKIQGLRTSAALISDATTRDLIEHLDLFHTYGVNAISVYVMGSRFADVKGYRPDATLDPVYAARLGRIIDAAEERRMVVLVGCLYWSTSRAKEDLAHWTQADANRAVANTVAWLKARNSRNVVVDPDNEGMAHAARQWSIGEMIAAGHAVDPTCLIAYNSKQPPPANANLAIHHSPKVAGKPYIETEGSPPGSNYWGAYSKREGYYNYLNVGVYTPEMMESQKKATTMNIERSNGYMFASTWLQAPPPLGPNMDPGGDGTVSNPGIKWWLEYLRQHHGPGRSTSHGPHAENRNP
jgi:hypothetical protein